MSPLGNSLDRFFSSLGNFFSSDRRGVTPYITLGVISFLGLMFTGQQGTLGSLFNFGAIVSLVLGLTAWATSGSREETPHITPPYDLRNRQNDYAASDERARGPEVGASSKTEARYASHEQSDDPPLPPFTPSGSARSPRNLGK